MGQVLSLLGEQAYKARVVLERAPDGEGIFSEGEWGALSSQAERVWDDQSVEALVFARDEEVAKAERKAAIAADARLVEAYRDLASYWNEEKEMAKRDEVVRKGMACGEFNTQFYRLAQGWGGRTTGEEAAVYEALLKERPRDVRLQYLTYRMRGDGEEGDQATVAADAGYYWGHHGLGFEVEGSEQLGVWTTARGQCPEGAYYRVHLAKRLIDDGRTGAAWELLEECRLAYPELLTDSEYFHSRGICLRGENKLKEAAASLFKAMEMGHPGWNNGQLQLVVDYYSEESEPARRLSDLWSSNRRYELARPYADLARRIDPGSARAWDERANIAWQDYEPLDNVAFYVLNIKAPADLKWLLRYKLSLALVKDDLAGAEGVLKEVETAHPGIVYYANMRTMLDAAKVPKGATGVEEKALLARGGGAGGEFGAAYSAFVGVRGAADREGGGIGKGGLGAGQGGGGIHGGGGDCFGGRLEWAEQRCAAGVDVVGGGWGGVVGSGEEHGEHVGDLF